jgi:LacI family transcriptional regulator
MIGEFFRAENFDVVHSWGPEELLFVQERHQGLLRGFGPKADAPVICHTQSELLRVARLSRSKGKRLAFMAASDFSANALVQLCLQHELRVPEDVAVIGVDNDWIAQAFCPIPLSSVILPALELGQMAMETALRALVADPTLPRVQRLQPVRIIEQQSTESWLIDNDLVRHALRLLKTVRPPVASVSELAKRLNVSRRTIDRQVRAELRITAYQLLRRARIDHGKTLLASTDHSLDEVARQCGFLSANSMANAFRQEQQPAPSRFRKQVSAAVRTKPSR